MTLSEEADHTCDSCEKAEAVAMVHVERRSDIHGGIESINFKMKLCGKCKDSMFAQISEVMAGHGCDACEESEAFPVLHMPQGHISGLEGMKRVVKLCRKCKMTVSHKLNEVIHAIAHKSAGRKSDENG